MKELVDKIDLKFNTYEEYVQQAFRLLYSRGLIPYVSRYERDGQIVHKIRAQKGNETRSSLGNMNLDWHNEVPNLPDRPDYFMLTCFVGQSGVFTDIIYIDHVVPMLTKRTRSILLEENVLFIPNKSHVGCKPMQGKLLEAVGGGYEVRVNLDTVHGQNIHQRAAIDEFKEICGQAPRVSVELLTKGETYLINNKKTLHARRGALSDPERELYRIYLKKIENI